MPQTFLTVPEWVDLTNLSPRANALMLQNTDLIDEAAALLNAGDLSPLAWERLQDIWAEAIQIEVQFAIEREAGDL